MSPLMSVFGVQKEFLDVNTPKTSISASAATVMFWTSLFVILGVSGLFCHFYSVFDGKSW